VVWPDRQWEWAALRFENGQFDRPASVDTEAREKWFYQAIGASPAMFRRDSQAGSLYWLGHRDAAGAYLDGGRALQAHHPAPGPREAVLVGHRLRRPYPQPDPDRASQGPAQLPIRLPRRYRDDSVDLFFGPTAPASHQDQWIQTNPGAGWFVYFRIYGPEQAAFDKTWKPGDYEPQA
jgi:hypothetical protein